MLPGSLARLHGGVGEKRVVSFMADYAGVSIDEILYQPLTPDASTRKYYRVATSSQPAETLIVSLYPDPFNRADNSFVDATRLFERAGLPVPRIMTVADTKGIIVQEDLGDMSLSRWLRDAEARGDQQACQAMLHQAIELIVRIQAATTLAYAIDAIAAHQAFDEPKLLWELNYFSTHFFTSYLRVELSLEDQASLSSDLESIARDLSSRPRFLTHRDYHGMNLMIDPKGELRLIDHQDARMGPVTYDLVPLLVERRLEPMEAAWIEAQQRSFLQFRRQKGLPAISWEEISEEFQLMTIQRQLKAVGTFSYQTAVVGRGEVYEAYLEPALKTVIEALGRVSPRSYPFLEKALHESIENLPLPTS
jgi:aminoglycoside/choline kinase family phosphotransferase